LATIHFGEIDFYVAMDDAESTSSKMQAMQACDVLLLTGQFVKPCVCARLLKFRAAHGTVNWILSFEHPFQFTIKTDADVAFWTVTVSALDTFTAHITEPCQAIVNH
jgi:hypothetical protein